MALTVLNVAYPLAPVGPDAVGGAEQVLSLLDEALVRAGHRSLVIAPQGSRCRGELLPVPAADGALDVTTRLRAQAAVRGAIARATAEHEVDLVHFHGVDFHDYLPPAGPPVLATLHLPPAWYPAEVFALTRPDTWLNCVSASQRAACPPSDRVVGVVANGVPIDRFHLGARKDDYAVALGRICPEKGYHLALEAATRAGVPLMLAGQIFDYAAHREYFRDEVLPRLEWPHRFLGPADLEGKRELLAGARCLLAPSLVPETSSLAAMEALACGTPVIAFRAGALTEIVEHGVTGFLVKDAEEMAAAIANAHTLDPHACRRAAEQRFTAEATARAYLELYADLARRARPRPSASTVVASAPSGQLTVATIERLEDLEALAPDWADLFDRDPDATTFQRPEWLLPWARAFAPGGLMTLAVRRDGRLTGLMPLRVRDDDGLQVATFLGEGVSDHLGPLLDPRHARPDLALMLEHLADRAEPWDRAELAELPEGAPLLAAALPARLAASRRALGVAPRVALPATRAEWERGLPTWLRRNVAYSLRRAHREGGLRFERATPDTVPGLMDALFRLHAARWQARGEPGVLADPLLQQMHTQAAQGLAAAGALRLYGVRIGGALAAVLYAFADKGRVAFYLSGFDPDLKHLSPGALALHHAMGQAIDEGAHTFDFLRGDEAYKRDWGATDHAQHALTLTRRP